MRRSFILLTSALLLAIVGASALTRQDEPIASLADRYPNAIPTSPASVRSEVCQDDAPIGAPRGFNLHAAVPADAVVQGQYAELGRCGSLLLADGATGEPLSGFATINAGHSLYGATSPDGSLFAAVIYPSGRMTQVEELHFYDLNTWRPVFAIKDRALRGDLVWSPDSQFLYLLHWDDGSIWQVDTLTRAAAKVMETGLLGDLMISADGATLYVFGSSETNPTPQMGNVYSPWRDTEEPFLSVIDTATWKETRRLSFPTVFLESDEASNHHGVALSSTDNRLYVAHADSEAITVVDLDSFEMRDHGVQQANRPGLPSRLLTAVTSLFVSSAEAKGGDYNHRTAEVSLDGRHLFTTASRFRWNDDSMQPLGLLVFDTRTMGPVSRVPDLSELWLSADGRKIIAAGLSRESVGHDFVYSLYGPNLIDAQQPGVLGQSATATWEGQSTRYDASFSLTGRFAHFVRFVPWDQLWSDEPSPCPHTDGCSELTIIDTHSGEIINVRKVEGVSIFLP